MLTTPMEVPTPVPATTTDAAPPPPSPPPPAVLVSPPVSKARLILLPILLVIGAIIWARWADFSGLGRQNPPRTLWLFICLILACIPPTRRGIGRLLDRLRCPSPRTQRLVMLGLAIASVAYLFVVARMQERDFVPRFHDEFMHLVQMRMLAQGRLWMPQHELADFFDTFHILVRPVYASIYFPGTALLYVASIWLNLPPWVMPLLAAGASVALLYRVISELVDGVTGLIAAMLLLSLQMFRFLSIMVMSHGAILLLGLAIVWAYLNWRRTRTLRWAAVLGAMCGWAAITRPFDAIAYATPIAIAVLLDLRTLPNIRRRAMTIATIVVAAAPFIALQLIENAGVTGHLLKTPYQLYAEQDSPNLQVGFTTDPAATARPLHSKLPQKQEFYDIFLKPTLERHRVDNILDTFLTKRLPRVTFVTLFTGTLVLLLPTFLLARSMPRAAVLWTMLPIYLLIYTTFPFLLKHYAIVAAPAMCLIVVLGARGIVESVPAAMQRGAEVFLVLFLAGIAIPPIRPTNDDGYPMQNVVFAARHMPLIVHQPAIVLFHYEPGGKFHEEPVYNIDAAWPDDESIIRAHDLGPARNRELFQYYAQRQPQRTVYLFDRMNATMTHLGNVVDLAHLPIPPSAMRSSTTTTPATSAPRTITTQRTLDEP